MENEKISVNVELEGASARYFQELKQKTGMNAANTMRYCIFEMWKREMGGVPDGR